MRVKARKLVTGTDLKVLPLDGVSTTACTAVQYLVGRMPFHKERQVGMSLRAFLKEIQPPASLLQGHLLI